MKNENRDLISEAIYLVLGMLSLSICQVFVKYVTVGDWFICLSLI
jgi:hypothetical protein